MKDFAQTGRRTKRYAESMPTIADDGFRVEKASNGVYPRYVIATSGKPHSDIGTAGIARQRESFIVIA